MQPPAEMERRIVLLDVTVVTSCTECQTGAGTAIFPRDNNGSADITRVTVVVSSQLSVRLTLRIYRVDRWPQGPEQSVRAA